MDGDIELRVNTISGSLDSSFTSKKPARKETKLPSLKNVLKASSICCLFVFGIALFTVLPITQLIIGVLYMDDCPIKHLIPIYLIVSSCVEIGIMIIIISLAVSKRNLCCLILCIIFTLFIEGWNVTGCAWIVSIKSTVQFKNSTDTSTYCHRPVYDCTLATIIIHGIILLLLGGGRMAS